MTVRRNIEAQESVVALLHGLIQDHQQHERYPHTTTSRRDDGGGAYTWNGHAMRKALDGIMEAFGYVVTEID